MPRKYALAFLIVSSLAVLVLLGSMLPAVQAEEAADSPCLAVTFDDGPCCEVTEALLTALRERGVHATFFLVGEQIVGQEELVRRMKSDGHQVGSHTYSHVRLDGEVSACLAELQKNNELLSSLLGEEEYWIRPPWGILGDAIREKIASPLVYWSVDPTDWQTRDSALIARCLTDHACDGDILLLHDTHMESVDAALSAIDTLMAQGYEFVTVEELFARKGVTPQRGILYARPDTAVTW